MNKSSTSIVGWGMNLILALGLLAGGAGCGGNDNSDTANANSIVGSWQLTSETTDGVTASAQSLGKTEVMLFDTDGQWSRVTIIDGQTSVQEGSWGVSGSTLTLTPQGKSPTTYAFTVDTTTLVIGTETIGHTFGFTFARR